MLLFCVCAGLLHAGDRIMEVNGFSVDGMEPEQVIQVVVRLSLWCILSCNINGIHFYTSNVSLLSQSGAL